MPRDTMQTYRDRNRAERAIAKRSLFANQRGECSQYELRQLGDSAFIGGTCGELATRFPRATIIGQWSAGYRVP